MTDNNTNGKNAILYVFMLAATAIGGVIGGHKAGRDHGLERGQDQGRQEVIRRMLDLAKKDSVFIITDRRAVNNKGQDTALPEVVQSYKTRYDTLIDPQSSKLTLTFDDYRNLQDSAFYQDMKKHKYDY